jgi:hypothetical protein
MADFVSQFGQIFDLSIDDYNKMNRTSKSRVLSSNANIKLMIPAYATANGGSEVEIGDIDNISFRKNLKIIKKFQPFGFKKEKILVEDCGWDISFSGGKTDISKALLFHMAELNLGGLDDNNIATKGNTLMGLGGLYQSLLFSIHHEIEHYDGSREIFIFDDVQLLSFEQSIDGDMGQINESVTAFSPSRRIVNGPADFSKITDRVTQIVKAISRYNRS